MDTPEGFDEWSEECKERFRRLKAEYDDRVEAERAVDEARRDADAKSERLRELREEQEGDEAELREVEEWLDGYWPRRRALRERLNEELQREFEQWLAEANRTPQEIRAKQRELQQRRDEALDELKDERTEKRKRRDELRSAIEEREDALDEAREAHEEAEARVEELQDRLDGMRSVDQMADDYYALIRECGPQDPQPGDPAIPITPRYSFVEPPRVQRPAGVRAYVGFLQMPYGEKPAQQAQQAQQAQRTAEELPFVGSFPDVDYPPDWKERAIPPRRGEPISDGDVWHEGCIELIWVQGTTPHISDDAISNPITRTVEAAAGDINMIWRPCCVRFRFFLKVVALADLGDIAGAADGVSIIDGKVTSASKEAVDRGYAEAIRDVQDHPECAGMLVVDRVLDGAGFARIGGNVGIITIKDGHVDRPGQTAAHEVGHAVGGIDHVTGEGDDRVEHAHGDLMWGEGCTGYPNRQEGRYERVTDADCAAMRAKLTRLDEPCEESDGGEPM